MLCPECGSDAKAAVMETRRLPDGGIRRRRRCADCSSDFETREQVSGTALRVRKTSGDEVPFDRAKVRRGIVKAAVRPHHSDRLSELIGTIEQAVRHAAVNNVVDSHLVGQVVMEHLKEFDAVTHVRFALTQLGRNDRTTRRGWRDQRDFRRWLAAEYPTVHGFHPPATISWVVKRDGRREPFDRQKLERSIGMASKGRGDSDDEVRKMATRVADTVVEQLLHQTLVTSAQLSTEIMRALRGIDHVAAIRFASTAKSFVSIEDYEAEALSLR